MFCTNCGKILTGQHAICPYCGARLETPDDLQPQTPPEAETSDDRSLPVRSEPDGAESSGRETPPKNRAFLFGLLGLLFASLALVSLLIALPFGLRTPLKYRKGIALLEKQDYEGARVIFSELGDYANAEALSETAERGVAYRAAIDLMENGDYRAARDAFGADPDFEDAAACIEACDRALCIEDAKLLIGAGDYEAALDRLETAAGTEEADALIVSCRRTLAGRTCAALMERGAYAEALDLLCSEDGVLIEDRDARLKECENRITYHAAEDALSEGRRSDAYKLFLALGDWSDAKSRVHDCLAPRPETGELYHDEAYLERDLILTVRPPADGTDTFFRVFAIVKDRPVRVADLFIRAGESVSTKLPEGTYLFKSAYGFEWFGESDLFGEGGVYQRLRSGPDSELFALEKGFEYTLVLRSEDSGNVDAVNEPPEDF